MARPAPSKRSSNPKTATKGNAGGGGNQPPRAHRGDTPEARAQEARLPKTHPTNRSGPAKRKDT
ncbi:MAG TPA: hypothetical protein VEA69_13000 [Tepidisphaeraceae bacterium]|nr:hypothetical protein [Tepidisphaeraceae bacterium]